MQHGNIYQITTLTLTLNGNINIFNFLINHGKVTVNCYLTNDDLVFDACIHCLLRSLMSCLHVINVPLCLSPFLRYIPILPYFILCNIPPNWMLPMYTKLQHTSVCEYDLLIGFKILCILWGRFLCAARSSFSISSFNFFQLFNNQAENYCKHFPSYHATENFTKIVKSLSGSCN